MPDIKLSDGKKISFSKTIDGFEIAKKISKSLAKDACIMSVNGKLRDLSFSIDKDVQVKIITTKDKEGLEVIRHDAAHVLAMAVQELFPGTQVTIGPVIEDGFYYDFARRKNTIRVAKQALEKAMQYAYRDRRAKKREFRSLWIQRINAGVRAEGITYSKFINGLNKSGIKLDRKVLADIAYNNPEVFKSIVKKVQSSLN